MSDDALQRSAIVGMQSAFQKHSKKLSSHLGFEYFFWMPFEIFKFSAGKKGLSA